MTYAGFIYRWTNAVTGDKYIGSHKGHIDDGYVGSGSKFNHAIAQYGIGAFNRDILEYVDSPADILLREQHYLDLYEVASDCSYYNVSPTAGGGFSHINDNEVLKEQCSKSTSIRMKLWLSDRNNHPRGMKGKQHKPSTIRKISNTCKIWADLHISCTVYQYDFDGTLIGTYASIADAARSVSGSPSNIKYTCDGKFTNAYGYQWRYQTESPGVLSERMGKKCVTTPLGEFSTMTEAVTAHGFSSTTQVRRRCLSDKYPDWAYTGN